LAHYLLTGAGFSRNWGGWLADEAFEYLLGCPEVDDALRYKLWHSKRQGNGFEDTLSDLQAAYTLSRDNDTGQQLDTLVSALAGMFNAMTQAFSQVSFEVNTNSQYSISSFLQRFDAIFTLNQDLLLEYQYLPMVAGRGRFIIARSPGIKPANPPTTGLPLDRVALAQPDPASFNLPGGVQAYFKLHGSANWVSGPTSGRMMILGGNKQISISQYPLLQHYHSEFQRLLCAGGSRLMVIGYSFNDLHINTIIASGVERGLKLFIIDPRGVDVADKSKPTPIRLPDPFFEKISPAIIGASRRSLLQTFASDVVEFNKIQGFFSA
jgi:hypothetical protein